VATVVNLILALLLMDLGFQQLAALVVKEVRHLELLVVLAAAGVLEFLVMEFLAVLVDMVVLVGLELWEQQIPMAPLVAVEAQEAVYLLVH
jgi:hypothetical protein